MPYLVIHNGDDQGQNFLVGLPGMPNIVGVVQAQFINQGAGSVIDPATFAQVQVFAGNYASLDFIWAGHGAGNGQRGTPLTNDAPPRRIAVSSFRRLIEILKPKVVIMFSCNAGQWIERQSPNLLSNYSVTPSRLTIHGSRFPLNGILRLHAHGYVTGAQPAPLPGPNIVSCTIFNNQLRTGPHPGLQITQGLPSSHSYSPSGFHEI